MIRRAARPTQDFTIVRNDVLRDSRMSYRARGILAAILSRPDNWSIRSEQLAREGGEGRDAIRTALSELRKFGYLHTVTYQDETTGKFYTDQVVYDFPQDLLEFPGNPQPKPGNPASVNQASVFQALLEEQKRSTVKKTPALNIVHLQFDEFWKAYPRKIGKGQARSAFQKALGKAEFQQILDGCVSYALERQGEDQTYTAHPATWLNGERWLDEKGASSGPKPATLRDRENDFVRKALNNLKRGEPRELR